MLTASATSTVNATPQQILEFVLDVEQYMQADTKITKVASVDGPDESGRGSIKIWGKLKGLPAAPDKQDFVLQQWSLLTFTGAPRQPGRLVFDFIGTFECTPQSEDVTSITHAYVFTFKGPFKLLEKRLATWLQSEVEAEVGRIGEILGA